MSCTPRTTISEPKCRRRNEVENEGLRKRLARCEELLQEYTNKDCADGLGSSDLSSTNAIEHGDQEYSADHTNLKTNFAVSPAVKFVQDNGVSRFMDSRLFGALIEEVLSVPLCQPPSVTLTSCRVLVTSRASSH